MASDDPSRLTGLTAYADAVLATAIAGLGLLLRHIFGRRVGQAYDRQRRDGRESRVIPRPEVAEVEQVRAGLARLEGELRHLDVRFTEHIQREEEDRMALTERLTRIERANDDMVSRVERSNSETMAAIIALTEKVGVLIGLSQRRRADDVN